MLVILLPFVNIVESKPYYVTRPVYFPSKSGSYITFDSSILPLYFETLYRDSSTQWHFNDTWITTTIDLSLTSWNLTEWLNYTVAGASTQKLLVDEPLLVQFDGVNQTKWVTWGYTSGVLTVTPSGTDVGILFGEAPELPEPPDPFIPIAPIAGALIQGEGFNIEVSNGESIAFQSYSILEIDVKTGFFNGTSCYLLVSNVWGELQFNAETDTVLEVSSQIAETSFDLDVSGANSTTLTGNYVWDVVVNAGNNVTLLWRWHLIESWVGQYTLLALGISGLIMMVASPSWVAWQLRKGGIKPDDFERMMYGLLIFVVGFGLLVMWLWS